MKQSLEASPVVVSVVVMKDEAVYVRLQVLLRNALVRPPNTSFDVGPE